MTDKAKDKKSKKDELLNKNTIIINPTLDEQALKKAVISWGRMNPPTVGHEKLINKVKDVARKQGAEPQIYLSHTQDAKKNPLSYDDKVYLAKLAFGNVIQKLNAKTIIDVMKHLTGKYDVITLVVGQDRVTEFETLLNKYNNGKDFAFKSIEVISAGERDPDAEGIEGMSASKMRSAAATGDEGSFKSGLPSKLKTHADEVYTLVRGGMKLSEDVSLDEAVLNYDQRRRRALNMRRYEVKMQAARERLKRRVASGDKLQTRSRKKAIQLLRKRVAGEKGTNYADLPVADKIAIDRMVEKRKGAIAKIAARLLPKVRQAELQRVASLSKESVNEQFETMLDEASKKRYHMMYNGEGKLKYDRRFKAFRHIVRQEQVDIQSDAELIDLINEAWDLAIDTNTELNEQKLNDDIKSKSDKSGIEYDTLKEVYDRGFASWNPNGASGTQQQHAYERVNSFIARGKTWSGDDADLVESIDDLFEQALNEGVNDPSIFKAVFLAGGPGSGKSFIVGKTALTALGMKVINSDDIFERALTKAGMKATPEDIYSPKGQEIRGAAKQLTGKKMDLALNGRLGLVIDGTGKDYDKIEKQAAKLKKIGYEVAMIFVNTDLDTAQARNKARSRSLPEEEVASMWNGVQKNIGKFQNFFGNKMFIIDNSEGSNFEGAVLSTYRKINGWAQKDPTSPVAKAWIADQRGLKEDRKSFKHHLGIGVPFKHIAKDALTHVDTDMDGDVDADDFKKTAPDETNAVPDMTKKFMKKYADEKKHTRKGVAFEQVESAQTMPPVPEGSTKSEKSAHVKKHVESAIARAAAASKQRIYHEENGAGDECTPKVTKRYKKDTPGETVMAEGEKKGLWYNIHQRRKKGLPPKKPGDEGYPKTLDIESVNEAFEHLMEAEEVEITASKMKDFEKFVDRMFEKFKIDFEFTKHFGERMNDERNSPKIKLKELADLIKKIYAKNGNPLKGQAGAELVIKDLQSDLNMPIVVKYDEKNDEIDIVAKTIMRKKNFSTPNQVIKY